MDIETFAQAVRERRLSKGWSVEEAARQSGINRVTYKRVEAGLPVQDVKRRAVEHLFNLAEQRPTGPEINGSDVARIVSPDLNPDLAEFTDQELLDEISGRMLVLAGRLQESGTDLLSVSVGQDGERRVVSHTTKRGA